MGIIIFKSRSCYRFVALEVAEPDAYVVYSIQLKRPDLHTFLITHTLLSQYSYIIIGMSGFYQEKKYKLNITYFISSIGDFDYVVFVYHFIITIIMFQFRIAFVTTYIIL